MSNNKISNITWTDGTTYDLTLPDDDKLSKFYTTASATANAFTVTIPGITELFDGMLIYCKFNAATASGATLNVNNLGAKAIYYRTGTAITTHIVSGNYVALIYDGTHEHWVMQFAYDANSNTIGYQLRTNSSQWYNKTGYSMNRYILLFEVDGGLSGAATTIGTATNKTTVAFKYIPGGIIKYYTASGAIANNALFAAAYLWDQYTLDLRYTFNTGSTLTDNAPVYMRCVVNSDGTLTPDYSGSPSHPIVQDLPTTEDSKVYVYLGQAYSTTSIELYNNHPCYEFKNGKIQIWSGDRGSSTPTGYWANQSISSTSSTTTTPTFGQVTITPSSGAAKLTLKGGTGYASGGITLQSAGTSSTTAYTLTLPAETDTLATQGYVTGLGYTSNTGTVTSVSAGTGLSISGTASVTPTVNIASGYKLPTTTEWTSKADASDIPTKTSDLTNDSGFITSSSLPTNYVTTDTTQSITGTKTFSSTNTYISGCGFSSSNNLGNSGYTAFMRADSNNPLFGLKVGSTAYYLQATSSGLYLGPTSSVATSWASDGSITIRGTTQPKWGTKTLATTDQIPSAVTESTVSGWGFTKNTGTVTSVQVGGTETVSSGVSYIATQGTYNPSTNKIATMSDVPSSSDFVTITGDQSISGIKTFAAIKIDESYISFYDVSGNRENAEIYYDTDGQQYDELYFSSSVYGTMGILNSDYADGGYILTTKTPSGLEPRLHKWWYYSGVFSVAINSTSTIAPSSLYLVNKPTTGQTTGTNTTVKVGDFIYTSYGQIAVVQSVPSSGNITYIVRFKPFNGSWTCLEEGTLITMADGSKLPIEEVKQGDSILGWDFEHNKSVEAIALYANFTHQDDRTNFVVFSNGEYLSATDDHYIYSVDKGRDAPISELEEGEKCLDNNGNEIEIYAIHRGIYQMGRRNYYQLVSSNNTYFANNIMNAAHPINKFNWLAYGYNQQIPDEIMEILEQDAEEFKTFEFLVKNDDFRRQSVALTKEIKTRGNERDKLKQYLFDTDYVAIKYGEGCKDIDPEIITARQNARDRINQLTDEIDNIYLPAYNQLVISHSPLGADTLLSNEERRAKYFKLANKRDNEKLSVFKKYYPIKIKEETNEENS